MRYINVVGTTGSGKSTFSKKLSQQLQLQCIELDDLLWLDNWQEASTEVLLHKLQQKMDQAPQGWVLDSNYGRTTKMVSERVDTIIWLDYPFSTNLYRLTKRTLSRVLSQKPLWESSNNTESLKMMLSKESILVWLFKSYGKNRHKYLAMKQDKNYAHIRFIHLTSPKQAADFLKQMSVSL